MRSRGASEREIDVLGDLLDVLRLAADCDLAETEVLGALIDPDLDAKLPLDLSQGCATSADDPPDEPLLDEICGRLKRRTRCSTYVRRLE
mmetsp:Transcript_33134/g.92243  ORF Transcript_33134/g.92243 Transcript_33134/m.92243 type:complete len:90 (-) Transcript_33134:82-351(-)